MSNEERASELVDVLLEIYHSELNKMKAGEGLNASLLREVREFLKQHHIELDPDSTRMQDLKAEHDELDDWRKRRDSTAR